MKPKNVRRDLGHVVQVFHVGPWGDVSPPHEVNEFSDVLDHLPGILPVLFGGLRCNQASPEQVHHRF